MKRNGYTKPFPKALTRPPSSSAQTARGRRGSRLRKYETARTGRWKIARRAAFLQALSDRFWSELGTDVVRRRPQNFSRQSALEPQGVRSPEHVGGGGERPERVRLVLEDEAPDSGPCNPPDLP